MPQLIEACPACGGAHETDARPLLCHNMLSLAQGIAAYLTDNSEDAGEDLLTVCEEIMGAGDDDDDSEVFN